MCAFTAIRKNLILIIIVVLNSGGPKSRFGTPHSVSALVERETDELLQLVQNADGYGKRKQDALKTLVRPQVLMGFCRLLIYLPYSHSNATATRV
jgi:hypothetical protein